MEVIDWIERAYKSSIFNILIIFIIPFLAKNYASYAKLKEDVKDLKRYIRMSLDIDRRLCNQLRLIAKDGKPEEDEIISCLTKASMLTDEMYREEGNGNPRRHRGEG